MEFIYETKNYQEMKRRFTIDKPMPPLWLRYPHISPLSIGWRMGDGADYRFDLYDWLETLSENEKKQYNEMFPPPRMWRKYYLEHDLYKQYYEPGTGNYGVDLWRKNGKPTYSKEWLVANDDDVEFEFFWKPGDIEHEPACCLGQWQYSYFENITGKYTCAEQYMMAEKARVFDDKKTEQLIMTTTDPKQMKALGRKVKNFNGNVWDKVKYSVVLNGNYLKFSQNKNMRDILLATGNKILVEASPLDKIWGIGYSKSDAEATNPQNWRGSNLLGFALMEVRDELKRVYQNYEKIDWEHFDSLSNTNNERVLSKVHSFPV